MSTSSSSALSDKEIPTLGGHLETSQSADNTTSGVYYEEVEGLPNAVYTSMLLFALITNVVGNTCTILAFTKGRRLRSIQANYILNLAMTDLSEGLITLPLMTVWYAGYDDWPFGPWVCKFLWVVDFMVCAESAFIITLISYDRWLLVKAGALYNITQTRRRVLMKISATWCLAAVLYTPAIIGWDAWRGFSTQMPGDCDVEFAEEGWFNVTTACVEFIVPLAFICGFNGATFWEIYRRAKQMQPGGSNRASKTKTSAQSRSSSKAAKSLVAVVVIYMLCWLPYSTVNLINTFCDECISPALFETVDWILWLNSSINPAIYVLTNELFRKTLRTLLCPCLATSSSVDPESPSLTALATISKSAGKKSGNA